MSQPSGDSFALQQAQEMAERQFGHMTRLIDDLLDISRISQGKVRLQKQPLDLRELLLRTCETWKTFFESSSQELNWSIASQPILVHGDPVRIEQVVSNLLSNANKFTPRGGKVSVELSQSNATSVISIQDNGSGIDEELIQHVFELFVQGDSSLDRSKGGLGIGLTLVQKLVELHEGQVKVSSAGSSPGRQRNAIYRTSGIVILLSLFAMGTHLFLLPRTVQASLNRFNFLFWMEWVAVWSFAAVWLTKGRAILADIAVDLMSIPSHLLQKQASRFARRK